MSSRPQLAFAAVVSLSLCLGANAQEWRESSPPTSPTARTGHAMAFDAGRGRTVLFGGYHWTWDQHFQDTWEFDGQAWSAISTASAPAARRRAGFCFDEQRGRAVLFGGYAGSSLQPPVYFGDTWEYDGASWQQVAVPGPTARLTSMSYDATRGVTVLHGGTGGAAPYSHTDTWEYDGAAWSQRTPAHSPPWFAFHMMAFDRARGVTVLQQGYTFGASGPMQTWEWDGVDWSQVMTPTPPPVFSEPALSWDQRLGKVVLVGAGFAGATETWAYDGSDWAIVSGATQATTRSGHGLAWDSTRGALVQFGGEIVSGMWTVEDDATYEFARWAEFAPFGTSCAAAAVPPSLVATNGGPRAGTVMTVRVDGLAAPFAALVTGASAASWQGMPLPIDLTSLGLPGCELLVSVDHAVLLADQGGFADWSFAVPATPLLHGATVYQQGLSFGAAGWQAATGGARLTVGL